MKNLQINSHLKKLIASVLLLVIISSVFFSFCYSIIKKKLEKDLTNKDRYHIVLNSKYGHADGGFAEQAVDGVCLAFKVSKKDCRGSHTLFKNGTIGYGYPSTMEDIPLVSDYVDNFIKNDGANNFVLTGFTFNEFLCKLNYKYEKQNINMIGVNTGFSLQNKSCRYLEENKWPKNLYQIIFKGYYAGYHSALYSGVYALLNPSKFKDYDLSKKGKQIAFAVLGGLWLPIIMAYSVGFKYGIQKVNEIRHEFSKYQKDKITDTELLFVKYQDTGGFLPSKVGDKTKAMSKKLYKNNRVSVILIIGVTLTPPVRMAALESNLETNKKQHWVIGAVVDQGRILFNEPENEPKIKDQVLTSAILKIKEAVTEVIKNQIGKGKAPNILGNNNHIKYSTIPERFKKNKEIWGRIVANNLDNLDILEDGSLPQQFDCAIAAATNNHDDSIWLKKFFNSKNNKISRKDVFWQQLIKGCL